MADPTFWDRMGFNGASANGLAGIETRPYTILSQGSNVPAKNIFPPPPVSGMAQKVLDDAAAIFPEFDGVTNLALPRPADFANPSFASFLNWHTAHQVQFLKENAPNWAAGDYRFVTFGTSANPIENETFLLSADGRRVIHVNQLQATDLAQLPLADQELLADRSPAFRALFANPLGLWPADDVFGNTPPANSADARQRLDTVYLQELEKVIRQSANYSPARLGEPVTAANLETHYPNIFLEQVDLIRNKLSKMAIFSPDAIGLMIADLKERYVRVERYATVTRPTLDSAGLTVAANSTDNLAGLDRARSVFLQTELRLLEIAKMSYTVADTGVFKERFVNTPLMVFLFQTQENYSKEAEAQARSEDLNQMNALIQTYTRIQKIVNDTLKTFDPVKFQKDNPDKPEALERRTLLSKTQLSDLNFTADEMMILSMFEVTRAKANNNTTHPLELDTNAVRPTFDFVKDPSFAFRTLPLKEHSQQEWDLFSQSLASVSKVLSTDSQARMDKVNDISRQKNRNYELATETLNKMTDILRSIVN